MEQLLPRWVCSLTSCETLESLKTRPRKRWHRKEGIRLLKVMKPAASSTVRPPSSENS